MAKCVTTLIHFSRQFYVQCQNKEDKLVALSNLYAVVSIGQAMIFCQVIGSLIFVLVYRHVVLISFLQTRRSAEWLAGQMCQQGHSVALITGDSSTDQRIAVLDRCVYF